MSWVRGSFLVWLIWVRTTRFASDSISSHGPSFGMTRAETMTCMEESTPFFKVETGRPAELRHDDALASIDNERAFVGHQRKIAEIDLGLDHLAVAPAKTHDRLDRRLERHVAVAALLDAVFGFA